MVVGLAHLCVCLWSLVAQQLLKPVHQQQQVGRKFGQSRDEPA